MKQIDYTDCKNLEEFKQKTLDGLAKVYSEEYIEYLKAMPKYLSFCNSYRELGTNQGGSASVALLQNLNYYEFIDKSFKKLNCNKQIFNSYIEKEKIKCVFRESNSLQVDTDIKTDFLLVDSVHKFKHVMKEIELYAPITNKYIMFHDTNGIPEVYDAVQTFLEKSNSWIEIERYNIAAGYTVIKKIHEEQQSYNY